MSLKAINKLIGQPDQENLMPMLFVGHGSPMNAIEENPFVAEWRRIGQILPCPKAIICVSAHWETNGTFITASPKPQTIHDFGGFPGELYQVQYPAPGSPELAIEAKYLLSDTFVGLDQNWGLDHGAWSVIKHLYPKANIPVIELSIDYNLSPVQHYQLAKQLAILRKKGVLFIGSGNMVHNLRMVAWDKANSPGYSYDWALQANNTFKQLIKDNQHQMLMDYRLLGHEVQLAIPTPDHFIPLLYVLAMKEDKDDITFFNDQAVMGSLTMTSVMIG
jgi:4,5-DOPA dioxygenase extradiol